MTNQQILEKAIQTAIDGGWHQPRQLNFTSNEDFVYYLDEISTSENLKWLKFKVNELIFNHDFAKALWGEEYETYKITYKVSAVNNALGGKSTVESKPMLKNWQYHLQQMVIAPDPIKYLGDNL